MIYDMLSLVFFFIKQELFVKIDFYLNGMFIVFERFLFFSEWKQEEDLFLLWLDCFKD